jgi:hypothetical protein
MGAGCETNQQQRQGKNAAKTLPDFARTETFWGFKTSLMGTVLLVVSLSLSRIGIES